MQTSPSSSCCRFLTFFPPLLPVTQKRNNMAWNKPTTTEGNKFSFAEIMKEQLNDACVPSGLLPPCVAAHDGLKMPLENSDPPPITGPQSSDDFALAMVLQQMEDEEITERRQQSNPNNAFEKVGVVSRYNTQTVFRHSILPSKSNTNHPVSSDYVEAKQKQAEATALGVDFKAGGMILSTGEVLTKHDAQLNALNNASKLTEMEGVGDMEGIMVNNSVANSIRSFTQKKGR